MTEPSPNLKCNTHPAYQAKRPPVHTEKNPGGCAQCWRIWNAKTRLPTWSESITDWQSATFGPVTAARAWGRFDEEFNELVDADCEPTETPEKIADEAADVVITFAAWVKARTGLDLAAAVERKMSINRAREWNVQPDGTGYHVKADRQGGAE